MPLLCPWVLCYAVTVSLEFALCRHCVFGVYIILSLCPWGLRYAVTVSLIVGIAQPILNFLLQGQHFVLLFPPPMLPQ